MGLCAGAQTAASHLQYLKKPIGVDIRIVANGDQPVPPGLKVQVVGPDPYIREGAADASGKIFFAVEVEGSFEIHVSGEGIDPAHSKVFYLKSGDPEREETVRVTLTPVRTPRSAAPAVVSVRDMLVPGHARKEFDKGAESLRKRDWSGAQRRLESAIKEYPQFDSAYDGLGIAKENLGDLAGAKQAYQKAIEINGHNSDAQRDLAAVLINEKDWLNAIDLLNKSLSVDPNSARALTLLTYALLQAGRIDDSIATGRRVHALEHGQFVVVHLMLARALEQNGDSDTAISEYQTYLREAPNGPQAAFARESIGKLTAETQ